MLNENYACKSQYIRNIYIYKYIKQKKDKKSTGKFVPKVFLNIIIPDLMEVFITHDESSPPVPFHLLHLRSSLYPHHCDRGLN